MSAGKLAREPPRHRAKTAPAIATRPGRGQRPARRISAPSPALDRLVIIAQSDTGRARRVANFLMAWWNATDCGGFDFTDLWNVDRAIADDILTVARLIATRHEYPTAYGYGPQFERLVKVWRP